MMALAVGISVAVAACGISDEKSADSATAGGNEPVRIGVMIKGLDNPFFAAMNDGVEAAAKADGADVEIQAAAGLADTSGQASKLEALIAQDFSCYVVNPISQTNLVQPLPGCPTARRSSTSIAQWARAPPSRQV